MSDLYPTNTITCLTGCRSTIARPSDTGTLNSLAKDTCLTFDENFSQDCKSDVLLLKQGCMIFKREFEAKAGFDPFDQITSACNRYLRTHCLQPNTSDFKIRYGELLLRLREVKITSGDVSTCVAVRLSSRSMFFYYGKVLRLAWYSLREYKLSFPCHFHDYFTFSRSQA